MWPIGFSYLIPLLVQPVFSRISPYDIDNNLRPDNITGLDYSYYSHTGSYYNGTLTLTFSPEYNPNKLLFDGTTCAEYENSTFKITMNAVAGFQRVAPEAPSPDPFFLDIYGWDQAYNLTNEYDTANYSEFQEIHLSSSYSQVYNETWWFYHLTEADSEGYKFSGRMSTYFLRLFDFKFNVSGICDTPSEDQQFFSGNYITEEQNEENHYFTHPISAARISGSFNQRNAWVETAGHFAANNRVTQLIGGLTILFEGQLDEERSDELLLGRKKPEWNATLGFEIGSVGGVTSGAVALSPGVVRLILAGLLSMAMLA
ncbi:hypothetical protein N7474_009169 [Penicillium riverlandense]|uniref:uncharacterized protein n=1 Tax=Penicillium riverlandense TaxID=1903569 RepID=UPI002547DD7F|nr:uncharacterized protein N7474_009169 [Penicillium riverlandense]KAJ5807900.1 hypothetical protein N7474_009169 [Penicillium riverlandense]